MGPDKPQRILIVDDEQDILTALSGYLAGVLPGVAVDTAASGPAGLEIVDRQPPDLILSDYKMPGMDGLQFLAEVNRRRPGTPTVLMTAYPDMELAIRALNEERIQHFFTKPIDPEEIATVVRSLLIERQARRQREAALARSLEQMRKRRA